jgi:Putative DNA-binding domain
MITVADIRKMLRAGESETVEFKLSLPPDHITASILSAFANTRGGTLIVGVGARGEVVGLPSAEIEGVLGRLDRITDSMFPDGTSWEIGREEIDGRVVAYLSVSPAPPDARPVSTSRGDFFVRESSLAVAVSPSPVGGVATRPITLFVAMSFREEEEPALVDYWWAVKRAVESTKFPISPTRIDLKEGDYEISQEIMSEIDGADMVLADFTLNSRNVYFELGYARGKKRRVLQTARKGTTLEFDVRHWKTLFYRNATDLEQKLVPALVQAYNDVIAGEASGGA